MRSGLGIYAVSVLVTCKWERCRVGEQWEGWGRRVWSDDRLNTELDNSGQRQGELSMGQRENSAWDKDTDTGDRERRWVGKWGE